MRRLTHLPLVAALAAAALFCLPSNAFAHDFDPERQLMVQVGPDYVDILIFYNEAPGERSDFFAAQFGLLLDDQLGDVLRDIAGRALMPRLMDGLEFEVVGESPRTDEPQVEIRRQGEQIQAAAYARYHLDELNDGDERSFIVRSMDRSFLPTPVIIYGDETMVMTDVDEALDIESQMATATLNRDRQFQVTFTPR